jgi:hypothetical protein
MPLTMYVETDRWRRHQESVAARYPGIVPVIKGNGYGVGIDRLAREAAWLRADTVAVGQASEAQQVSTWFPGQILIMHPHHPAIPEPPLADGVEQRVIRVVASVAAAQKMSGSGTRVVLELLSSVRRHGVPADDLQEALEHLDPQQIAGFAMHLPLPGGRTRDPGPEIEQWLTLLRAAGGLPGTVWLSHVSADRLTALRTAHPDVTFRPRIGTELWLGDAGAIQVAATVCDVHRVRRGERYGYRGRRAPWDGHVVVLSGGTAHGLGLEAPRYVRGLRARIALGAQLGLAELNWSRSPYTIGGKRPMLAEPPHMQVSLVLLPAGIEPPSIGAEVPVQVRKTTARADRVVDR